MKKKWKKLVLTEVSPSGWLKEQMQMQMNGLPVVCMKNGIVSVPILAGWEVLEKAGNVVPIIWMGYCHYPII